MRISKNIFFRIFLIKFDKYYAINFIFLLQNAGVNKGMSNKCWI